MQRLTFEEFNKEYKSKWINYCEIIIDKEGMIIIANPSHTEAMLRLTGETRDIIYKKMPIYASPIHWFVKYLEYVSVWNKFQLIPETINIFQMKTLELLEYNGFIKYNPEVVINP